MVRAVPRGVVVSVVVSVSVSVSVPDDASILHLRSLLSAVSSLPPYPHPLPPPIAAAAACSDLPCALVELVARPPWVREIDGECTRVCVCVRAGKRPGAARCAAAAAAVTTAASFHLATHAHSLHSTPPHSHMLRCRTIGEIAGEPKVGGRATQRPLPAQQIRGTGTGIGC